MSNALNPVTSIPAQSANETLRPMGGTQVGDTNDIANRQLQIVWDCLKRTRPHPGGIDFSKLIVDIENDPANTRTSCLMLFNRLTQQIETQYGVGAGPDVTDPSWTARFANMQRQLMDTGLEKVWGRIGDFFPGSLDEPSAADIRSFLNDPAHASELNAITELNLEEARLYAIPPEIYKLTNLRRLDLSRNHLTSTLGLSALTHLKWLDLHSNRLTAVPDLSALTQLIELDLRHNRLSEIPGVSALNQLQTLSLRGNRFTALPDLSGLTQLTFLGLDDNPLTTSPNLSTLHQLRDLTGSNNQLSIHPRLDTLTQLLLESEPTNNSLTAAPNLSTLPPLQAPNPSNNPYTIVSNSSVVTQPQELQSNNDSSTAIFDTSVVTQPQELQSNNDSSTAIFDTSPSVPPLELNPNNTPTVVTPPPVRSEGFIQRFVRKINSLFTNLSQNLKKCFRFLKGLIGRA